MSAFVAAQATLYLNQMVEVKRRLLAIDRVLGAKNPRTLDEKTDDEFMWLQLRKIIELVTYSAIASDLERYAALRAESNKTVDGDQSAKRILNWLSSINPKFLPIPLGQMVQQPDGSKHFTGGERAMQASVDQFTSIFSEASEHLHAPNPYANDAQVLDDALHDGSRSRLVEVHRYLKGALWEHYKVGLEFKSGDDPKSADGPRGVYLIQMGNADVPEVQMLLADKQA